ncbi:protein kinase domain containing protein, partial [Nannochloropsis gaditana]
MGEKDNTTGALLSASLKSPAMFRGAEAAGSLRRQRASSTSFKSSAHNESSPAKINLPSSSLSAFEVDDRLGKGAFGVVHRARRKQDGKWYVIKTVSLGEMEEGARSEAVNEVHILASISSPYVVKYYDSFVEREELHIVMEYCNRGDLQRIIHKLKRENCRSIAEEKIWAIFVQVALGLHHLHSRQILHRDMKAANVFIHKDEASGRQQVKIGDLGVAKLLNTKTTLATTMVGTPYYLSPELCRSQAYDARSDVWSLGVLLYQCCTLKLPFDADNPYLLMTKIIEGEYEALSSKYLSTSLVKLVERLLTADPQRRPSLQNILSLSDVQAKCLALGHALPPSVPPVPSSPPPSPSPAAGISVGVVTGRRGSTTTPKPPELASSTRPTSSSQHQVREGRERLPSLVSSPPRQTLPLAWTGADHDSPNPQLYPENAENPTSPSPTWTRGRQPSRLEASQELPAGTARGSGRVPALALPPPLIISPHSSLDRDPFSPSPSHRHHRPSTLTPASSTSPPPPPLSSSTSSARARLSSRNSFGRSTDLPAHRKALSSISDSFAPELVGLFP